MRCGHVGGGHALECSGTLTLHLTQCTLHPCTALWAAASHTHALQCVSHMEHGEGDLFCNLHGAWPHAQGAVHSISHTAPHTWNMRKMTSSATSVLRRASS